MRHPQRKLRVLFCFKEKIIIRKENIKWLQMLVFSEFFDYDEEKGGDFYD